MNKPKTAVKMLIWGVSLPERWRVWASVAAAAAAALSLIWSVGAGGVGVFSHVAWVLFVESFFLSSGVAEHWEPVSSGRADDSGGLQRGNQHWSHPLV